MSDLGALKKAERTLGCTCEWPEVRYVLGRLPLIVHAHNCSRYVDVIYLTAHVEGPIHFPAPLVNTAQCGAATDIDHIGFGDEVTCEVCKTIGPQR